jgi:hypothetical protein
MFAFVWSIRMPLAGSGSQRGQGRRIATTILAGVSGLFATFVERVLSLVGSDGVTLAGSIGNGGNRGSGSAAVFAIIVGHGGF